jgi:hypothetical protein
MMIFSNHVTLLVYMEKQYKTNEKKRAENRASYKRHKEKRLAYSAQYREQNREKNKEYARQYRLNNPEKMKEAKANHYQKNKEKLKAKQKQFRLENPEKVKQACKERYWRNKDTFIKQGQVKRKQLREKVRQVKERYGCLNPSCKWTGAYNGELLDCHHLDPTKKLNAIGHLRSRPQLTAELSKCTILCANCHRLLTYGIIDINDLPSIPPEAFDFQQS